ncbi:DUF1566 domain-containing protein [Kistimonas asteriae]|uniref:Lcl C-terminal domain-containing protein n=1 Tax=Kistimonas asteriae TaxID=517724 RepID=UPI001BA45A5B|nr:DUF1566 domain-containing protein [Kistimonas asteriae]
MNKYGMLAALISIVVFLQLLPSVRNKQHCDSGYQADTTAYHFNADGTVRHRTTGLVWERCLVGQTLNNAGTPDKFTDDYCEGKPSKLSWFDMQQRMKRNPGARLPSITELKTTMIAECKTPAVNLTIFPGTPHKGLLMSADEKTQKKDKTARYFYAISLYSSSMQLFQKNSRAYARFIREQVLTKNDKKKLIKQSLPKEKTEALPANNQQQETDQ